MSRRLLDRPEIVSHDIVTRAMHEAKSDDFGGMSWSEPLEVLTRSLDREASLTMSGRRAARTFLTELLVHAARLRRPTTTVTSAPPSPGRAGPRDRELRRRRRAERAGGARRSTGGPPIDPASRRCDDRLVFASQFAFEFERTSRPVAMRSGTTPAGRPPRFDADERSVHPGRCRVPNTWKHSI
jgi:hypothetical protein